jgi:hypothetical protein
VQDVLNDGLRTKDILSEGKKRSINISYGWCDNFKIAIIK